MLANRYLCLAKLETTYGTDPTPSPTTDLFVATNPTIEIQEKGLERNIIYPSYGNKRQLKIGESVKVSFSVELKGSGNLNTAPLIGRLFRACNFTETITVGTSISYSPNSSATGESVTIYVYKDAILHKVHGCVGTFKIEPKLNEIAMVDFEFTGLYGGTGKFTDTTFPSFTYDSVSPIVFRNANATFNSVSHAIKNVSVDIGNVISQKKNVNATTGIERYFISNRNVKGSIDFEVVSLGTENPFNLWSNQTEVDIDFYIGENTGNKLLVSLPKCAIESPKYGEDENLLIWSLSFRAMPGTTGNTEIELRFV